MQTCDYLPKLLRSIIDIGLKYFGSLNLVPNVTYIRAQNTAISCAAVPDIVFIIVNVVSRPNPANVLVSSVTFRVEQWPHTLVIQTP